MGVVHLLKTDKEGDKKIEWFLDTGK